MKKLMVLTAIATALFATRASAANNLDEKYLTVDMNSSVIEELTDQDYAGLKVSTDTTTIPPPGTLPIPPTGPQVNPSGNSTAPLDEISGTIDVLDKVVNLVDKIFTLIAKNQPVVNINVNYANAVPFGTSHWTQLQGWSKPATKKYEFYVKNLYGMKVVNVIYQVHWTYGGNVKGVGKFLTGVTVEPLSVNTAWGYNVDLTAEVPDSTVANVGTSENPVASMQVQLKWKIHTIIKDAQEKSIYYVQGDGFMQPIGTPFTKALEQQNQKKLDAATEQLSNVRF